jgi:hypothetical protein
MPKGNRTERRGIKLRRDIRLTDASTEKLRRVWRTRSLEEPGLTEDEIVNALIMQMAEPVEDQETERPPSTNAPFDAFRELRPDDGEKPIIL